LAAAAALIGLGWGFGKYSKDTEKEALRLQLNSYQRANKLDFKTMIAALLDANKNMEETLDSIAEFERLRKENKSLKIKIADTNKVNEKLLNEKSLLEKKNKKLTGELLKATSETISHELNQGEGVDLITNAYTLGIKNIYSDWVDINLNNKPVKLEVGNKHEFEIGDRIGVITLKKIYQIRNPKGYIDSDKCLIEFIVSKPEK